MSPALAGGFFTAEPLGKPRHLLIHSSADRHLDSFHILAMVNRVVMRIGLPVSFQIIIFSRYISKSWIPGPYGNSMFSFFVCF